MSLRVGENGILNSSPERGYCGPQVARGDEEALGEAPATPEQIGRFVVCRERAREAGGELDQRLPFPLEGGVSDEYDDLGPGREEPAHAGRCSGVADLEHAAIAPVDDVGHHGVAHEVTRSHGPATRRRMR